MFEITRSKTNGGAICSVTAELTTWRLTQSGQQLFICFEIYMSKPWGRGFNLFLYIQNIYLHMLKYFECDFQMCSMNKIPVSARVHQPHVRPSTSRLQILWDHRKPLFVMLWVRPSFCALQQDLARFNKTVA